MGKGSGVAVICGVGSRCSSDLVFLWLWLRPAAAAPIRPLAWESLYAAGAVLKIKKKKKKIYAILISGYTLPRERNELKLLQFVLTSPVLLMLASRPHMLYRGPDKVH